MLNSHIRYSTKDLTLLDLVTCFNRGLDRLVCRSQISGIGGQTDDGNPGYVAFEEHCSGVHGDDWFAGGGREIYTTVARAIASLRWSEFPDDFPGRGALPPVCCGSGFPGSQCE